jgi:hypothetical protein
MKQLLFGTLASALLFTACKKSKDDNTAPADKFMSTSAGSTWNYAYVDNNNAANNYDYTRTSTTTDTSINAKSYHKYSLSTGGSEYYAISGSDYYTYAALPAQLGGTNVENLYLKDNAPAGTNWSQVFNIDYMSIPLAVTANNTIAEKGISRIVNGTTYNNVIKVTTTLTPPSIPGVTVTTNLTYYYAPKVGLIEDHIVAHIEGLGAPTDVDTKTTLTSANIL